MHMDICSCVVLWLLFDVVRLAVPANGNVTIDIVTVGIINNAIGTSYASQGPPIDASVEELQQSHPNITFRYTHVMDRSVTDCISLNANVERMLAEWFYGRSYRVNMTVIMNAACMEGTLINRLAAGWNCLYISTNGYDYNVMRNKLISPSYIVTTSVPLEGYASAYRLLLHRYQWTSIYIVIDDNSIPVYSAIAGAVDTTLLQNTDIKPTTRHINRIQQTDEAIRRFLKEFSMESRVLLFFGNANLLRKILLAAASFNMTGAEYVYITVEHLPNFSPTGNLSPVWRDMDDKITVNAYQSVLVMEPANPDALTPPNILRRFPEFEARTVRDYNVTFKLPPKGWAATTYSYLEGLLFSMVLEEALLDKADLSDGASFARRFLRRTFKTKIGSFYIDVNGVTQLDLAVSFFNYLTSARQKFLLLQAGSSDLQGIPGEGWNGPFGKGIPSNEPFCGYDENDNMALISSMLSAAVLIVAFLCFALWRYRHYHETWWLLADGEIHIECTMGHQPQSFKPWDLEHAADVDP